MTVKAIVKKIVPGFLINWYHFFLSFLGAFLYWFPSKKIKVIGITGTSGKSTTVELTARILEEAGVHVIKESETQKAVKFLAELLGVK